MTLLSYSYCITGISMPAGLFATLLVPKERCSAKIERNFDAFGFWGNGYWANVSSSAGSVSYTHLAGISVLGKFGKRVHADHAAAAPASFCLLHNPSPLGYSIAKFL